MYELSVLTCWRGFDELVPVPGATALRLKGMLPRSFLKLSSGSVALNGIEAPAAPLFARPNVWSRNWPQTHAHWLTLRCEKRSTPRELNTLLLTKRGFGPATIEPVPSA